MGHPEVRIEKVYLWWVEECGVGVVVIFEVQRGWGDETTAGGERGVFEAVPSFNTILT